MYSFKKKKKRIGFKYNAKFPICYRLYIVIDSNDEKSH